MDNSVLLLIQEHFDDIVGCIISSDQITFNNSDKLKLKEPVFYSGVRYCEVLLENDISRGKQLKYSLNEFECGQKNLFLCIGTDNIMSFTCKKNRESLYYRIVTGYKNDRINKDSKDSNRILSYENIENMLFDRRVVWESYLFAVKADLMLRFPEY